MICLTLHSDVAEPRSLRTSAFRVAGAVIWDSLELGLIAYLANGSWWHAVKSYNALSVTGPCRLVFGISRDPEFVSERLEELCFRGSTLYAGSVPFARYSPDYDMWCGIKRPMLWTAMLAISDAVTTAFVDERPIEQRNLWEAAAPKTASPQRFQ